MKKILFTVVALLVVALMGCASAPSSPSAPVNLAATAHRDKSIAAATLAKVGTCEVDVAPDLTALIISRQRATNALTRGAISVETAKKVQALADRARLELDAACPDPSAKLNTDRHAAAKQLLLEISQVLEKKQ